jgi:diguanylate cyclase (GGDEF)-like protein
MSIEAILLITAAVLACGCAGLLVVRAINPRLLGLGWLGAAFASGGLGATFMFAADKLPRLLSVMAADLLVLAAFVLLHAGVLELMEAPAVMHLGAVLLGVQAVTDVLYLQGDVNGRGRALMAGLLIAALAVCSAVELLRGRRRGIRAPIYFNGTLLLAFAGYNTARSLGLALHQMMSHASFYRMEALTFMLFLVFGLGIAFGFFWLTTARLTTSLDELASTDPLTRLFNRRVFLKWCEREIKRSGERGIAFSVLMLDLDHFKSVNDRFGHAAGDEVLCVAVEKMQDSVRGIDVLGRWGGEEFVALLPGASADAAYMVAQRMRRNIEKTAVPVSAAGQARGAAMVQVTASVGVATYKGASDSIDQMLKRADAALYGAKESGRNRVLVDAMNLPELLAAHSS